MLRHQTQLFWLGVVLLFMLICLSLATGAGVYGGREVAGFLLGDPALMADEKLAMIIHTLRLPRTLCALVVGVCLALAASMLQSATRNPLAEPGLLGVNAGAVFALVIGLTYFGVESAYGYLLWSGMGALLGNLIVLGLGLIYLVLVWSFSSWSWPLVVMSAIPLGLAGALFGHWLLDVQLTILSLFGLFGLSGIVVNNSIILVSLFKDLRDQGQSLNEALVGASCGRLRAVLLTSLTTIGGLTPLLFESSLQAQFLIPMATSIAFGLGFSAILILFFVPALLSLLESFHAWTARTAPHPA